MKNFKRTIILSIIILIIVVYFIYDYLSNKSNEFIEEDVFVEEGKDIVEVDTIILHITGEVNFPRDC